MQRYEGPLTTPCFPSRLDHLRPSVPLLRRAASSLARDRQGCGAKQVGAKYRACAAR